MASAPQNEIIARLPTEELPTGVNVRSRGSKLTKATATTSPQKSAAWKIGVFPFGDGSGLIAGACDSPLSDGPVQRRSAACRGGRLSAQSGCSRNQVRRSAMRHRPAFHSLHNALIVSIPPLPFEGEQSAVK